jgi:propanol-preferring alcohol dehydrogenase
MKAMQLRSPCAVEDNPLELVVLPIPEAGIGEILIRVEMCGICRTDLHVVEGDLPLVTPHIIPGHEVVGHVVKNGPGSSRFEIGTRVGAAWLYASCGVCRYCLRGDENLCERPLFTGYHKNGGFAEYLVAREQFVYALDPSLNPQHCAPLLCAGIIGYRAFARSRPTAGEPVGLYGFGASAHIVIQLALHIGCPVYVSTRGEKHRELARSMGAVWVGDAADSPPVKLHSAVLFAPAGELVPPAMRALDRGGTLAIAGIYLSAIPEINYDRELFLERTLCSVTANTRKDGEELLRLASEIPIVTHTELFPLEEANEALRKLKQDGLNGAGVLQIAQGP